MEKNQIHIDRTFFSLVTNSGKPPLYCNVVGRKNSKVIKFSWSYQCPAFTWKINIFIDKIKEKYENIEGSTDKEIIDDAQQLWIKQIDNIVSCNEYHHIKEDYTQEDFIYAKQKAIENPTLADSTIPIRFNPLVSLDQFDTWMYESLKLRKTQ